MSTDTASAPALERNWWLRAPAVLVAPRAVFASLRDESDEAAEARQEPLTAIAALAGIAGVLVEPDVPADAERRLACRSRSIPVLAFIGGVALRASPSTGSAAGCSTARRAASAAKAAGAASRHVLALAATPLALSLLTLWPVRIAVYGEDLFRTGGDDYGRGDAIFGAVYLGFVAWSVLLLLVGVRAVHGWTWGRAGGAVALAAASPCSSSLATSL